MGGEQRMLYEDADLPSPVHLRPLILLPGNENRAKSEGFSLSEAYTT